MRKKFYANWWFIILLFAGVTSVCLLITFPIISESIKDSKVNQEFLEAASSSPSTPKNTELHKSPNTNNKEQLNTKKPKQLYTKKPTQLNTENKEQLKTKKPKQNNKIEAKSKNTPIPKTVQTQTKATVEALDILTLFAEYDLNKVAADEKYRDKRFAIVGTVANINTSSDGKPIIEFQGKDSESIVSCQFPKDANTDIEVIKKGDIITVKGVCQGITANTIFFKKCKIVR